jgi:hypothetical protein
MLIYQGSRIDNKVQVVYFDDERNHIFLLTPKRSQALFNHSPDGFNYGYGGSGPAQLALALLLDVTENPDLSVRLHQDFKWEFVAKWDQEFPWKISEKTIAEWVTQKLNFDAQKK